MKRTLFAVLCLFALVLPGCRTTAGHVVMGDERLSEYLPLIEGKRVALLSNHTGLAGVTKDSPHIIDVLISNKIDIELVFSPEHGFRGTADAGELVDSSTDPATGVRIVSLYGGRNQEQGTENSFDVLLVDIQDVGLRFYTYYITMMRMMRFCADHGKKVIILDRPNPNGFKVDGPVLERKYKSGVGALPVPVLHGMTLGELALMIVGEGWLYGWEDSDTPEPAQTIRPALDLTVIPCANYTHRTLYELSVAPSPNLRSMRAVWLYPSTCLFEGTTLSLGRGTDFPFEVYGHPDFPETGFKFTPRSVPGAKYPPLQDRECNGVDLRGLDFSEVRAAGFDLSYIIDAYHRMGEPAGFFRPDGFFELLVGTGYVREMIEHGSTAAEIRACWAADVEKFSEKRSKYLIYN